ncbi:hypothetical protein NQZ68_030560 [Dissostichus eleginoides]|nr:hypothetical protein NQZ68_030560 [Dissostichus eleginoides]
MITGSILATPLKMSWLRNCLESHSERNAAMWHFLNESISDREQSCRRDKPLYFSLKKHQTNPEHHSRISAKPR